MPAAAVEPTVTVILDVPEPGAAMDVGAKLTVTPDGWPVADSATAELNPPEMAVVIVDAPDWPCATVIELGEAEIVNVGTVTVSDTVVVLVCPPPVPVTVMV